MLLSMFARTPLSPSLSVCLSVCLSLSLSLSLSRSHTHTHARARARTHTHTHTYTQTHRLTHARAHARTRTHAHTHTHTHTHTRIHTHTHTHTHTDAPTHAATRTENLQVRPHSLGKEPKGQAEFVLYLVFCNRWAIRNRQNTRGNLISASQHQHTVCYSSKSKPEVARCKHLQSPTSGCKIHFAKHRNNVILH